MEIARRVRIAGRVQGVGYRAWAHGRAEELGLRGWVRNDRDGTVEALVAGPEEAVEILLSEFSRGPGPARVGNVSVLEDMPPETFGFEVRR